MSQKVLPDLPGLSFPVIRTVVPPPVTITTTPSQREYRARDATLPRYQYSLPYDMLRSDSVNHEMQQLVNFYNKVGGSFDSWLFNDPDDNTADGDTAAVGDGATLDFQLSRAFGGIGLFTEPIFDLSQQPALYEGGHTLNMIQQSTALDQSPWIGSAIVTPNTANSPDGTKDGDLLTDNSAVLTLARDQILPIIPDNQTYTFSVHVLHTTGGTAPTFCMKAVLDTSERVIVLDTDTGSILFTNIDNPQVATIGSPDGNWFRVSGQMTNNGSNTAIEMNIYPAYGQHGNVNNNPGSMGSKTVYGAKIEVGDLSTFTSRWYSVGPTAIVHIIDTLGNGTVITWSGGYYRRCRFLGDTWDVEKFMYQLWDTKALKFISTNS